MKTAVLYGASLRWRLLELRRYAFDMLSGVVSIYGFFVVIFFGARIFGGDRPGFGETIEGVVVSYAVWSLTMLALGSLTYEIVQEAQQGTLEQLGMSPFGLSHVLVARVLTSLVVYFGIWVALFVLMMATSGRWLNVDVVSVLPLIALTILGVFGLGFLLGGLAIVFKRIQQALQIWQVLVIGLVLVPPDEVVVVKYLPLAWGTHLLRRVMVDDASILDFSGGDLLFLVVNTAFYFFGGVYVFTRFERAARERGLLGHY
ncbi:MAG: ABC transporter permease [Actinomycetota bacterium]